MKRPVRRSGLLNGARFACCMLLASLISVTAQLSAAQPQELRLFHEPLINETLLQDLLNSAVTDEQLSNSNQSTVELNEYQQPKNQQDAQESVLKPLDADKPTANTANNADREVKTAYQYNGFISTASGQHYLVNGRLLTGIDALVLVSVKLGGKSLVLKTPKGRTFELSVGQSISKDSL